LDVDIATSDSDPTTTVLKAIAGHGNDVEDAVVRLGIDLPAEAEGQLRDSEIRNALGQAHYFTISRNIKREARVRLGGMDAEKISPLDALKSYLESTKGVSPERAKLLLEYGERLIQEQRTGS
jgi:exonuclease SbcD